MNIYIDVGHGKTGEDTGTTGYVGSKKYNENEEVLEVAKVIQKECELAGHKVTLSRTTNQNITTPIKKGNGTYYSQADSNLIASANKCKAGDYDFMISLHLNSSSNENATGAQIFYKTGATQTGSQALAEKIEDSLRPLVGINSIGTKVGGNGQDYYGCLRLHDKIGVLIEVVFMSNPKDLKNFTQNRSKIGKAIAGALNSFATLQSGVQELEVFSSPHVVVESKLELNDIKYFARVYNSKYVELSILKPVNVLTNLKSGATYWNSVLENGTDRIYYYTVNPEKEVIKFTFDEIVKVGNGGTYTKSNARSYNGAISRDCIQAWYLERGTSTNVVGTPCVTIGGYVDAQTYDMITR